MPNLAFHIEVLNQVIAKRAAQGDAIAVKLNNPANAKLKRFAVLGAMGPDMLRYMPVSQKLASFLSGFIPDPLSGKVLSTADMATAAAKIQTAMSGLSTNNQALAFELYFNPLGAIYSVLFSRMVVQVWPTLDKLTDFFNKLEVIVQNQDEIALGILLPQLSGIQALGKSMTGLPSTLALLETLIGTILTQGPWMEMNQNALPPADVNLDRRYEFLRWHHTSEFVQQLVKNAASDNQKAYVFGWQAHVASSVTAEPFINNITGGPYRTHWWRNRLVGNYVDSWTFGFFEQPVAPAMSGDNPTPFYFDPITGQGWPALCDGGNLQNEFNVGNLSGPANPDDVPEAVKAMATGNLGALPNTFPAEITSLFSAALTASYPASELPFVGVDSSLTPIPAFNSKTLSEAYVGAFAVYWFMSAGRGALGSNVVGPGTGMPEPSWVSSGGTPTPAQGGLNIGAAICAALLAILGFLLAAGGDFVGGLLSLDTALALPVIDWGTVANDLFWLRKSLIDQENALQKALVLGGLAYPPPAMLGARVNIQGVDSTLPATDLTPPLDPNVSPVPTVTGVPLCKSNSFTSQGLDTVAISPGYPRWLDTTSQLGAFADLNFISFPLTIKAEAPLTQNLVQPALYPQTFVNGTGLKNGGILHNGPYPTSDLFFGDAVSNAVQLIAAGGSKLPDYNLDGDRGYGWLAWDPKTNTNPFAPPVVALQEP